MKYTVYNYGLNVGDIQVSGVASSAAFIIGDNETMVLSSMFDTPPESLIIGPFVPFARKQEKRIRLGEGDRDATS